MRQALMYKIHPQQTSLSDALEVAKHLDFNEKVVLDPFCGTGTLVYASLIAGARKAIGSDIEDWSSYLRPQLKQKLWTGVAEFHWGFDALKAVELFEHDVLFTDPPNPMKLEGSAPLSLLRDLGMSGNDLRRLFKEKLHENNLMGKKAAVGYVKKLIFRELKAGKRIIIHAFSVPSRSFSWKKELERLFEMRGIYKDYFEVVEVRVYE